MEEDGAKGDRSQPPARPCPLCRRPADPEYVPFCSKRCADIDLNRWLKGVYVIPARDDGPDDEAEES